MNENADNDDDKISTPHEHNVFIYRTYLKMRQTRPFQKTTRLQ